MSSVRFDNLKSRSKISSGCSNLATQRKVQKPERDKQAAAFSITIINLHGFISQHGEENDSQSYKSQTRTGDLVFFSGAALQS